MSDVHGHCDPRFAGVQAAFEQNFTDGDLGASCAVTLGGELLVDLWGGHRDIAGTQPWQRDTITNIWSTTKMATALCVLMLHDRGALSIDEPMAAYWPEFAQAGKAGVLVRHVLGHTAGLPMFTDVVDDRSMFDWSACCARLAAQSPQWTPGQRSGYHAETQGWLLGELVRRVDGRTLGTFWREEVAQPLGVDLHIGVADNDLARVADTGVLRAVPIVAADQSLQSSGLDTSSRSAGLVNTTAWRRAEFPASNGHANARAVAAAMAPLANGGHAPGPGGDVQLLSPTTIDRCFDVQADGVDAMLGRHIRFGIGYGLNGGDTPLGTNDRTLWWAGWGGSMCVIDVQNAMTVSYVMNEMRGEDDWRAAMVIFAAHAAVGEPA